MIHRSLVLPLLAIIMGSSAALPAQEPRARDSTARDSLPSSEVVDTLARMWCDPHCLGAALYSIVLGPPLFGLDELLFSVEDSITVGFWRPHISLAARPGYGAVSGGGAPDDEGESWSAAAEVLLGSSYAELWLAHWDLPDRLRLQTIRIGRLRHARAGSAMGMTLAYQRGRGDRVRDHDGIEVGFPLFARTCRKSGSCWLRFEPRYRFPLREVTRDRVGYHYLLQGIFLLGDGRFFTGFNADAGFPFGKDGVYSLTVSALFGTWLGATLR